MILDGLDHHGVLIGGHVDLHAPRVADACMRHVAVAGDLVRRVHDDDALAQVAREHARDFAQHGGLAHARPAQKQDGLAGSYDVKNDIDGAVDRASDAARQADDLAVAVAQARNTVQRLLDAGAVVLAEFADARNHCADVVSADRRLGKVEIVVGKACFRQATEVEDDLDEILEVREVDQRLPDGRREDVEECVEFPVAGWLVGEVLFQDNVTSCDRYSSTLMVRNFSSTGPWMWTPASISVCRYSIVSSSIRSPGQMIGIPGGYGVITSAQIRPALLLKGTSTWSLVKASRGVSAMSGIGGMAYVPLRMRWSRMALTDSEPAGFSSFASCSTARTSLSTDASLSPNVIKQTTLHRSAMSACTP